MKREHVAATLDPAVVRRLRELAAASGLSFSRALDAAARRGIGMPDLPPVLEPAPDKDRSV